MLTLKRLVGWALNRALSGGEGEKVKPRIIRPDEDNCGHHHTNKNNLVGKGSGMFPPKPIGSSARISEVKESFDEAVSLDSRGPSNEESVDAESPGRSWVWIPSRYDLETHWVCFFRAQI